jgi:DUF1016 N-terminal domain/YhcG PDDEXK nuclease domain
MRKAHGPRRKHGEAKAPVPTPALNYDGLVTAIAQVHDRAQRQAVQAVNLALTLRNWLVGYHIVEYEQRGSDRAQYGERLLDNLTQDLRKRLGRGFGRRNLFLFREFYLRYPIVQSVIAQFGLSLPSLPRVSLSRLDWQDDAYFARLFRELPWTHFIELIREEMEEGENPPIGLILCAEKNETHVEYALGGLSNKVFVSRYRLHLPTREELEAFFRHTRQRLER